MSTPCRRRLSQEVSDENRHFVELIRQRIADPRAGRLERAGVDRKPANPPDVPARAGRTKKFQNFRSNRPPDIESPAQSGHPTQTHASAAGQHGHACQHEFPSESPKGAKAPRPQLNTQDSITQKNFESQDGIPRTSPPLAGPVTESVFFVKPLITAR